MHLCVLDLSKDILQNIQTPVMMFKLEKSTIDSITFLPLVFQACESNLYNRQEGGIRVYCVGLLWVGMTKLRFRKTVSRLGGML